MASERDIAEGVMRIAAGQANGLCTFDQARRDIPNLVQLDAINTAPSQTRPGEPMWHQIVRNIKSHDVGGTNYIGQGLLVHVPDVGYEITAPGRDYLRSRGLHP